MHKDQGQFSLALVTGASTGIGAALCRLLAKKGVPLLVMARSQTRLDELADELKEQVPVTVLPADLETEEGRKRAIEAVREHVPDLVVNCAGFGLYGPALEFDVKQSLNMVDLNVKALLEITLEAAKTLVANNKKGTILNVSSASDLIVFPGFAVYAATKAFVTQFSQALDVEMRPQGVRILVTCPGVVKTEFRKRAAGKATVKRGPAAMDVDFAATQLWGQIASGKAVHYFDFKTRVMAFLARFVLPRSLVSKFLYKTILSYRK